MKTCLLLGALSMALSCCLAAIADTEPGPTSLDDVQDIVFLSETRPVLIRLHIRIDGQSYQAAWNDFMQHVFAYLDKDKDGLLSREEAEHAPPVWALFSTSFFGVPGLPTIDLLDTNGDGQVTAEELGGYYRRFGGAPFQMQVRPGQVSAPELVTGPNLPPTALRPGPLRAARFRRLAVCY